MSQRRKPRALCREQFEPRTLMAADLGSQPGPLPPAQYSIDGGGNNLARPDWGRVGTELLRIAPPEYADGVSSPAGGDRPSAREISNSLADQGEADIISRRGLSAMTYAWGQFIDHDLDLTPTARTESLPIAVPQGDPSFDPAGTGTQSIPFGRSVPSPGSGTASDNPREQFNSITTWLDGSMIYGSDPQTARALRTLAGGALKMSDGGMLPRNNAEFLPGGALAMQNSGQHATAGELFAAGDVRANENIELTALHTLFVREHNQWAARLAQEHPTWGDEQLYQGARAIVIAELQAITYNQWLPTVLGRGAVGPYRGYQPQVNPGISNEFATAGFRFGHSLLGDDVEFLDDQGRPIAEEVPLSEAFFNPDLLAEHGIDPVLKYLSADPASELDPMVVDSVRNFLFGPPGSGGLDLASLNIQRGRDHGLADYNQTREALGLPRVDEFSDITRKAEVQAKLAELYGSVDEIDLWVGVLAEDHVPGASVGPTARAIIADQFARLRDGDRLWYQNTFHGPLLAELERTTLSDVMRRNTELANLQENAFLFQARVSGTAFADADRDGTLDRGERRAAGVTVELVAVESGDVVATTRTDRSGRYSFDVVDGLRTGEYVVRAVPPRPGLPVPVSREFSITRGDQTLRGVNLALPPQRPTAPVPGRPGGQQGPQGPQGPPPTESPHRPARPTTSPGERGMPRMLETRPGDRAGDRPVAPPAVGPASPGVSDTRAARPGGPTAAAPRMTPQFTAVDAIMSRWEEPVLTRPRRPS